MRASPCAETSILFTTRGSAATEDAIGRLAVHDVRPNKPSRDGAELLNSPVLGQQPGHQELPKQQQTRTSPLRAEAPTELGFPDRPREPETAPATSNPRAEVRLLPGPALNRSRPGVVRPEWFGRTHWHSSSFAASRRARRRRLHGRRGLWRPRWISAHLRAGIGGHRGGRARLNRRRSRDIRSRPRAEQVLGVRRLRRRPRRAHRHGRSVQAQAPVTRKVCRSRSRGPHADQPPTTSGGLSACFVTIGRSERPPTQPRWIALPMGV